MASKELMRIREIEDRWLGKSSQLPDDLRRDMVDLAMIGRHLDHQLNMHTKKVSELQQYFTEAYQRLRTELGLVAKIAHMRCTCQTGGAGQCPVHQGETPEK